MADRRRDDRPAPALQGIAPPAVVDLDGASSAPEDAAILEALRARNPGAARPLWQRYARSVFRILQRTLGSEAPIDDAVHDVFLRIFRRGHRLRPRSNLDLFVMRAVARTARLRLRRQPAVWLAWRLGARPHLQSAPTDQAMGDSEALARFYRVLDRLGASDRIVFVLYFMEQLDVRDVAAVMGKSCARTERSVRRSLAKVIDGVSRDPALAHWTRPRLT